MGNEDTDSRLPTWPAAALGALLGLILFVEALVIGGPEPRAAALMLLGLVLFPILLGGEWKELHFVDRHGVGGFFARWALAGASVGATAFGIGRWAEAWPWWGLFGALGMGAVLGCAVGLEWGRLLRDSPWPAPRPIEPKPDRGLLQIDRNRTRKQGTGPKSKFMDRPQEPEGV